MALLALLRVTIRQTWMQPALIFALMLQLLMLGTLAIGLDVTYDSEQLASMKLFTFTLEEPEFFVHSSLPPLAGLLLSLLMFLLIVGTGSLYAEYLSDPLLDVVLTRIPSRALYLISRLCGIWISIWLDLFFFAGSLCLLLAWKTGGTWLGSLFMGAIVFLVQSIVISAFCTVTGILTENTTGVVIIGLLLQFLVGNAGGLLDSAQHPIWHAVTLMLPRTHELNQAMLGALFGGSVPLLPLIESLGQVAICTAVAVALFVRRDL